MTALFFACYHGKEEVVKLLFELGADVHAKSKDSMRAMHGAAASKSVQVVRLLLDHNAGYELYSRLQLLLSDIAV